YKEVNCMKFFKYIKRGLFELYKNSIIWLITIIAIVLVIVNPSQIVGLVMFVIALLIGSYYRGEVEYNIDELERSITRIEMSIDKLLEDKDIGQPKREP